MAEPLSARVAIVGAGLIGSSIARAAREFGAAREIAILDTQAPVMARVRELGIADEASGDPALALKGADLVIICTPVGVCGQVAQTLAPFLAEGAILSDVGSVKSAVVAQVAPHVPARACFIPAHPIAGTEFSGPDAGFATLFQNRWCILTPPDDAPATATEKLAAFWTRIGAKVEIMTAAHHDKVLALTSHLPHLIAYNIVGTADDFGEQTRSEVIKFSASGFRDFTRIASSDPTMWRDVFLNNRDAVLEMLGRFTEDLLHLQRAIRYGEGDTLFRLFAEARSIRQGVIQAGQDTAAPNFGRTDGPAVTSSPPKQSR